MKRSAKKRPKFEDMLLDLVVNAGGDPQAIRERDWRRIVKSNQGHIRRAALKAKRECAEPKVNDAAAMHAAHLIWGDEYAAQSLSLVDWWAKRSVSARRLSREAAERIIRAAVMERQP